MFPIDPYPEDFIRFRSEQRLIRMQQARDFIRGTHSRGGLLARYLQRLADRIDPTGEARRDLLR